LSSPNLDIVSQFNSNQLFGQESNKSKWKMEYEDRIYKIYNWDKNPAAYVFPKYDFHLIDAGQALQNMHLSAENSYVSKRTGNPMNYLLFCALKIMVSIIPFLFKMSLRLISE